jgi:hypothetical protein
MKLIIEKPVVVITPTIGSWKLNDAMFSVENQTYKNIRHLVVVDGEEHLKDIPPSIVSQLGKNLCVLPTNTGRNGFYGHRIYAAFPHLVNEAYVAFLDEDNWYAPDHIKTLVSTLEQTGSNFSHSLRKIYKSQQSFICDDNCESLGQYPVYGRGQEYLVDTSSYLFKREFLIQCCQFWHYGWGADRNFFKTIKGGSRYACTGKHTLCYRLDGNPNSPQEKFFLDGNKLTEGNRPWIV